MILYKTKQSEIVRVDGGSSGQSLKKYSTSITGDGVKTVFTIEHSLDTEDILFEMNDGTEPVLIDYVVLDKNNVNITFALAPTNDEKYNVIIYGTDTSYAHIISPPCKNPIYLFNCENGTNLLGNIVKYGEWGISIPSSITVNSDGITVSVSKESVGGGIFCRAQYNNFKIDDISKYSKIAVEFEYISGCYTYDVPFGYTDNNLSYGMIYPFYLNNGDSNNNNEIGISNSGKGKVILDSVSGIQHRELNQKVKDLLISTSTSYRLGFQINIGSDNGIIDTIFRIKKIWIE